ncbi:unnamed protein product, partial [Lymnaea stagnalis]
MTLSKDIDLLLIGGIGNGKSALGNTILRRKAFISESGLDAVTRRVSCEVSEYNGHIIKVVDCPGVEYKCHWTEKSFDSVVNALKDAITINPRGYPAFILVVRYGGRFTDEDQDVIDFLKNIFGDSFVKDFCILVLTCGDLFNWEVESEGFQDWCNKQQGHFKELVKECCNRVVLFDNRTKDTSTQDAQLNALITVVDNLRWREKRYTNE